MLQEQSKHAPDPVVAAMERVLEAEREAERKLAECRQKADAIIAAARERGAEITQRANARLSKTHAAYIEKIGSEIGRLRQGAVTADAAAARHDGSFLIGAVRRLAANMTSGV
jgi:vacuolar-type H+-ATPase subunit H